MRYVVALAMVAVPALVAAVVFAGVWQDLSALARGFGWWSLLFLLWPLLVLVGGMYSREL